jgi:glycosyltransferase involved in cell wall biosynthesis
VSPKISIVTPSFNQGQYLEKTIQSVLNQNYPNLEYIIIDGGSTDNSLEIIKKYEKQLAYWISEKDNGQSEAINKGLSLCTGDIIAWINSDDYYEPDTFEKVVAAFSKNQNVGLVYGKCRMISVDEVGNKLHERIIDPKDVNTVSLLKYWKSHFLPLQPSMFWLKSVQDKTTLLDVNLNYAMDMHFWLQLSNYTLFAKVDSVLSNYLIHTQSKSGSDGGFSKFKIEWKQVANSFVKNKPSLFKFMYFLAEFLNTHLKNFIKKMPLRILGIMVNLLKKITGIKEFGFINKN